jgi:hypothetical protein
LLSETTQLRSARRKRTLSHNSTGSSLSPDSGHEDDGGATAMLLQTQHVDVDETQMLLQQQQTQQQQQFALILKRTRANGEEAYAFVDLPCFLAASKFIPDPSKLASAKDSATYFNVLAAPAPEEEELYLQQQSYSAEQDQSEMVEEAANLALQEHHNQQQLMLVSAQQQQQQQQLEAAVAYAVEASQQSQEQLYEYRSLVQEESLCAVEAGDPHLSASEMQHQQLIFLSPSNGETFYFATADGVQIPVLNSVQIQSLEGVHFVQGDVGEDVVVGKQEEFSIGQEAEAKPERVIVEKVKAIALETTATAASTPSGDSTPALHLPPAASAQAASAKDLPEVKEIDFAMF